MSAAMIGCTVDASAVLDAQCGFKVAVRDYFWEGHNPAYLAGYAAGRPGMLSWKLRNPVAFPATDFTAGKHDAAYNTYLDDALALGMISPVIMLEHETDAAAAAASGTLFELDAALLHGAKLARAHPLWKGSGAKVGVCLTGWKIADLSRGPAFRDAIADADVAVFDPYALLSATLDVEAGPIMDWMAKNFPGKEVQFGEWGIPAGKPGRAAELAATVASFATARYAALSAAYYWNGSGFAVMGTPEQAALVSAIKKSGPVDWKAQYDQLMASYNKLATANAVFASNAAALRAHLQTIADELISVSG